MKKFSCSFFLLFSTNLLFCQWNDISIPQTKAYIFDLDARYETAGERLDIDTMIAVGWTYTNGFTYFTNNAGEKWDTLLQTSDFFPFSVRFLPNNLIAIAGYHYLKDEAAMYFLDKSSQNFIVFLFDGVMLPYCKNFFDIAFDSNSIYVCGYNGKIFRYSLEQSQWEEMPTNSNSVIQRMKILSERTGNNSQLQGFAIGGSQFDRITEIFRMNAQTNEWTKVFDFRSISKSFHISSFDVFAGDSIHPFSLLVSGFINDTILIYKSTDYGENWYLVFELQSLNVPYGLYHRRISYLLDDEGNIWKSSDYGDNWTQIHTEQSKQFSGFRFFSASKEVENLLLEPISFFGFGMNGRVMRFDFVDILSVKLSKDQAPDFVSCKVYDIFGNLCSEFNNTNKVDEFFARCPNGCYMLIGFDYQRKIYLRKILKIDDRIFSN